MEDLRYPIGQFTSEKEITDQKRNMWIEEIAQIPVDLKKVLAGLTVVQLDTPYRPGGWTVRQVVHHLPDSHMNGYIRFKLALTEDTPTIRTFMEDLWADLADYRDTPIETSLLLLESLHQRWVALLRTLQPKDFRRAFQHPESGILNLDTALNLYAWHGKHHIAQIASLRKRMGW